MKPKINVYSTTASFVIFSLILVGSIIGMFMFIKIMGENTKYPSEEKEKETTTVTTTTKVQDTNVEYISYITTLKDVIGDKELIGNYSLSVGYQGTNYYFKCTSFNNETNECDSGLALLQHNNNAIPLYVFASSSEDLSKMDSDFYIMVQEKYVVFTNKNNSTVYTITGDKHMTLDNVITSYNQKDSETINENKYPTIENDNLIYYLCDTNTVFKRTLSLENKNVINQEIITDGVC